MQQAYVFQPDYWSMWTPVSSFPWERNCQGPANAFASFLLPPFYCPFLFRRLCRCLILSSFVPIPCLALSFSPSRCVQHMVTLPLLPHSKRQGKHLGDVQSRLAVKNLGADSTVLIENLEASGGTTSKQASKQTNKRGCVNWKMNRCNVICNHKHFPYNNCVIHRNICLLFSNLAKFPTSLLSQFNTCRT